MYDNIVFYWTAHFLESSWILKSFFKKHYTIIINLNVYFKKNRPEFEIWTYQTNTKTRWQLPTVIVLGLSCSESPIQHKIIKEHVVLSPTVTRNSVSSYQYNKKIFTLNDGMDQKNAWNHVSRLKKCFDLLTCHIWPGARWPHDHHLFYVSSHRGLDLLTSSLTQWPFPLSLSKQIQTQISCPKSL